MTTLAAIVCAYTDERWDDIVDAIGSLQTQQPKPDEIVLVIDHNEALLAKAQKQFGSDILVVPNSHRNGLSGARNSGIDASASEVIAFLDDDAAARPGWASALIDQFSSPEVVGVGGKVEPNWRAPRPSWWPLEFDWVVGCSYIGLPTKEADIRNPIGANMAVRRKAFTDVGGFSPALGRVGKHPVGCEETELFIRIHQEERSSVIRFAPGAVVDHNVPAARANFTYFRQRCFAEGISKAVVAKLAGSGDALSSERSYSTKVLPAGVIRGIVAGIKGDRSGFTRAAAIIAGLGITTFGYVRGRLDNGKELRIPKVEA